MAKSKDVDIKSVFKVIGLSLVTILCIGVLLFTGHGIADVTQHYSKNNTAVEETVDENQQTPETDEEVEAQIAENAVNA